MQFASGLAFSERKPSHAPSAAVQPSSFTCCCSPPPRISTRQPWPAQKRLNMKKMPLLAPVVEPVLVPLQANARLHRRKCLPGAAATTASLGWVVSGSVVQQCCPRLCLRSRSTVSPSRRCGILARSLLGPVLTKHADPGARHQVSAGSRHVIALDSTGNAYAWGWGQVCHLSWACGSFSAEAPCAGVGSADNWGWVC